MASGCSRKLQACVKGLNWSVSSIPFDCTAHLLMNKNTATFNMKARGQLETADTCIDSVNMSTGGLLQMQGVSTLQQMKSVGTVQLQ